MSEPAVKFTASGMINFVVMSDAWLTIQVRISAPVQMHDSYDASQSASF
jgi:hypothetical protein